MLKSIHRTEMSIVYTSCSYFIIYTVNLKVEKKTINVNLKENMCVYTQHNSGRTKDELSLNNPKM